MTWTWELHDDARLVTVTDPGGESAGERRDPTRWEWEGAFPRTPVLGVMAGRADEHREAALSAVGNEEYASALRELAAWMAVVQAMAAEDTERASVRGRGRRQSTAGGGR